MLRIAYLANQFPAAVEPYVGEEIQEMRRRGVHVVASSVRKSPDAASEPVLCLEPVRVLIVLRAFGLLLRRWKRVSGLLHRVLLSGKESPVRRVKALLHTLLGAYYAALLQEHRVDHIHVHHGYFGSWIAMVAARLLKVNFSLTLHGSDLLLHGTYLDTKLQSCEFCVTISEYNRRYILQHFPAIDPRKILVARLGVDLPAHDFARHPTARGGHPRLRLLSVGRLHAVKDHAFLVRACKRLRGCGLDLECWIAGEGPERQHLESLIREYGLQNCVHLLGHLARQEVDSLYRWADVVVLTSRSEGIPLVLMEAMARGSVVIAPAITGVPELVSPGRTGFLYVPGDMKDLVARIHFLGERIRGEDRNAVSRLDWMRHAARAHVLHNFSRRKNLTRFADRFLRSIAIENLPLQDWSPPHEDFVLQQIQLSLQRN